MLTLLNSWGLLTRDAQLFFFWSWADRRGLGMLQNNPSSGVGLMQLRRFCQRQVYEFQVFHEGLCFLRNSNYWAHYLEQRSGALRRTGEDSSWRLRFWVGQPPVVGSVFTPVGSGVVAGTPGPWMRLRYFLLLINLGWSLLPSGFVGIATPFKYYLASGSGYFRGFTRLSTASLWVQWGNLYQLLFNIFYYNIPVMCFGQLNHKPLINALNWKMWTAYPLLWRYAYLFFYFKYTRKTAGASRFFSFIKNQLGGLALVVGVEYHYHTLSFLRQFNIYSLGLCDLTVDPWLCWYPILCRGSDVFLQHLFLVFVLKLRMLGYALWVGGLRLYVCRLLFLANVPS